MLLGVRIIIVSYVTEQTNISYCKNPSRCNRPRLKQLHSQCAQKLYTYFHTPSAISNPLFCKKHVCF